MLSDRDVHTLQAEDAQAVDRHTQLSVQAASSLSSIPPPTPASGISSGSVVSDDDEKNCVTERRLCKPLCRPEIFLVALCLYVLVESVVVTGLFSATLSSIERRYSYTNTQMAYVQTSYDVGVCVLVSLVSYVGGKYHAPRTMAMGFLFVSIGALLYSLPQFMSSNKYQPAGDLPVDFYELCTSNNAAWPLPVNCAINDKESFVLPVLIIANLIIAIGASPLYTLGTAYIDQIVPRTRVPIYLGIFYAVSAIGPAIGFLLAGVFLAIWVDSGTGAPAGLTKDNINWVGAWWLGYLIAAIVGFVFCIPMFFFPKFVPGTSDVRKHNQKDREELKVKAMNNIGEERKSKSKHTEKKSRGKSLAIATIAPAIRPSSSADTQISPASPSSSAAVSVVDGISGDSAKELTIFSGVKALLKNHTYLLLCLGVSMDTFVVAAYSSFLASTVQAQYALPASTASFNVGLVIIPGAAGGIFFGGWLVRRLNLGPRLTARLCFIIEIITFCILFGFIGGCDKDKLAGVNYDYYGSNAVQGNTNDGFNFTYPCNSDCSIPCHEYPFKPVCGNDGVSYYSACYAGCAYNTTKQADGSIYFSACNCVNPAFGTSAQGVTPMNTLVAKQGMCTNNSCTPLSFYLFFLFLVMFATFSVNVPALTTTLRCLQDIHRPLGMGMQSFIYRALGTIPGPLALGALLDSVCQLWDVRCGDKGSCLDYDNSRMRLLLLLFAIIPKVVAILAYFLVWQTYPAALDEKFLSRTPEIELAAPSAPNEVTAIPEAAQSVADRIEAQLAAAEREASAKSDSDKDEVVDRVEIHI